MHLEPIVVHLLPLKVDLPLNLILSALFLLPFLWTIFANPFIFLVFKQVRDPQLQSFRFSFLVLRRL